LTLRPAPRGEVAEQVDEWAAVFGPAGMGANIPLGTARWFAPDDVRSSGRRSRMMQIGYAPTEIEGLGQYSDEPRWIP